MSVPPYSPYNVRLASAAFEALRGRPSSTDLLSEHIREEESFRREIYPMTVRAAERGIDRIVRRRPT